MGTIAFTSRHDDEHSQQSLALSNRQRQVLDAIRSHVARHGYAPSFREIGDLVGLKSPSSVKHQLQVLADRGYIRIGAKKGRAIELVEDQSASTPSVPSKSIHQQTAQIFPFPTAAASTNDQESIFESRDVPLVGRIAAGTPITASSTSKMS